MADNLQKVHERSAKAAELADASEAMAEQSGNFASAARRLRQQAEANDKGFFGLF